MKPRLPTAEERRLWKESNRFTKVVVIDEGDAPLQGEDVADPSGPAWEPAQDIKRAPVTASMMRSITPLNILPAREAAKRFKAFPTEATLDLHGMGKVEAYAAVIHFLRRQQGQGRRHVCIITGKGRPEEGVLKRELPHWLNEATLRPLVSAFGHARPEKGGAGVMHVLLKRI